MHLEQETIESFAAGTLSDEAMERASAHIESCDRCAAMVDERTRRHGIAEEVERLAFVTSTRPGDVAPAEHARNDMPLDSELAIQGVESRLEHLEVLGTGATGIVYRAWDASLGRFVAIKYLHEHARTPDAVHYFQQEMATLGRVQHPNLVSIYSSGRTDDGTLYYSMQLVDGISLSSLHRKLAAFHHANDDAKFAAVGTAAVADAYWQSIHPFRECIEPAIKLPYWQIVARLMYQIAMACQSLHDAGIVHRDVKLSNIRICPSGQQAILLDLGLAESVGASSDTGGQSCKFCGSLPYASPEQLQGDTADPRDDIYGLGVVLWEMLTHRMLFRDIDSTKPTTEAELISATLTRRPPSIRKFANDVPVSLEATVMRCLEKDSRRRFRSMTELAADLERAIHHGGSQRSMTNEPREWQRLSLAMRTGWLLAFVVAALLIGLRFGLPESSELRPVPTDLRVESMDTGDGKIRPVKLKNIEVDGRRYDVRIVYGQDQCTYPIRLGDLPYDALPEAVIAIRDALVTTPAAIPTFIRFVDSSAHPPLNTADEYQYQGEVCSTATHEWQASTGVVNAHYPAHSRPQTGFATFQVIRTISPSGRLKPSTP